MVYMYRYAIQSNIEEQSHVFRKKSPFRVNGIDLIINSSSLTGSQCIKVITKDDKHAYMITTCYSQ